MAEPIEIIIRQGGSAGGVGPAGSSGTGLGGAAAKRGQTTGLLDQNEPGNGLMKQLTLGDAMLIDAMKSQARQIISYGISQYGNLTGDYIGQRNIKNAISVVTDITTIGIATGKYGLPGFIAASIAEVGKIGTQYISYTLDIRKQNIQAEFMRERAGSTLGSGSRGTYE